MTLQYVGDVRECLRCGMTMPGKYLVDGECRDVARCGSFKETGSGGDPWPSSKSALELLEEPPEPPSKARDMRSEEELDA